MTESNNFSDMNDNFDTIKTMLNSIRAQGVLNTSDMDKLLEGINSKLEKINTEEDIDLIKAFLSELKKNLDERHEVLISKFGAIESLFSNILKNSTDAVKTGQIQELFDIVATNLSVFSREVVSQKETLTDITLRLDAIQSDDSKKKDIIKSVSSLKNDIDKINNGFDSIVISLNENFKTVLKTISEIDQSEAIGGFTNQLNELITSSNTILSAIQLIDKKNNQFEGSFEGLAKQEDLTGVQHALAELSAKSHDIITLVDTLTQRAYKIDNLSDKIDASVNIIAGLKAQIEDKDDTAKSAILERLNELENTVRQVSSNSEFEEFKKTLESAFSSISSSSSQLDSTLKSALNNIEKIGNDLQSMDINSNLRNLTSVVTGSAEDVKEKFVSESEKLSQMLEVNVTRTLNDITSNAEVLNSRLKESNSALSDLCEKNFSEMSESITNLKEVVAQLDENNVSANNAIFSNITDRLAIFENSLKTSLEKQEDFVSGSSSNVVEQIINIKNLAEGIEYKLDSNAIEFGNAKREYSDLAKSVNSMLAMDFVNEVKNFKVELYAAKQDLTSAIESVQTDLSENFTNDLFGKYELLISKLDSVEDEIKNAQVDVLKGLQTTLSNISSSIMDILSYVSATKDVNNQIIEDKLSEVTTFIQDSNLNYIENVRDVVELIRMQVDTDIKELQDSADNRLSTITSFVAASEKDIKADITKAYDKIIELSNDVNALNTGISSNQDSISDSVDSILISANNLKEDFELKINTLKNSLLDTVSEFKNDFSCENADKMSEFKHEFDLLKKKLNDVDTAVDEDLAHQISIIEGSFESLNLMLVDIMNQAKDALGDRIKHELTGASSRLGETLAEELEQYKVQIEELFESVLGKNNEQSEFIKGCTMELNNILENTLIRQNKDSAIQLGEIETSLSEMIHRNFETASMDYEALKVRVNDFTEEISSHNATLVESLKSQLDDIAKFVDSNLDVRAQEFNSNIDDMSSRVQGVISTVKDFNTEWSVKISDMQASLESMKSETSDMLDDSIETVSGKIEVLREAFFGDSEESVKSIIEEMKKSLENSSFVTHNTTVTKTQEILDTLEIMQSAFIEQHNKLKQLIEQEIKPEFGEIKTNLKEFFDNNTMTLGLKIDNSVVNLCKEFTEGIDSLFEKMDKDDLSLMDFQAARLTEFSEQFSKTVQELKAANKAELSSISESLITESAKTSSSLAAQIDIIKELLAVVKQNTDTAKKVMSELLKEHFNTISANIEKETDVIVGDILEQFGILKDTQKDEFATLTTVIEGSVAGYVIDATNDIKSYLDIKSDPSVLNTKLDVLRNEMESAVKDTTSNIKKLLETSVFTEAITDLRTTNDILINSMAEKINSQLQDFIKENVSVKFADRINLFDKKITETIVDNYEEIRVQAADYNKSISGMSESIESLISKFVDSKEVINTNLKALLSGVDELKSSFAELKAQILNKSLDEAFHASVNNKISGIESLVKEQMGYIEDISDLCCTNLPEITEMSTIVKHGIQTSVSELKEKIQEQGEGVSEINAGLNALKTDVITQFINIFNQISFVAEQEEILDFIDEKHSELITILSHIVNTSDEIETVKDNLAVVDNKMDSLKEDIDLINEKITSILSSEGDIDYVYSLQDLESDIANLRVVLNEMKENNNSETFNELLSSTNNIHQMLTSIQSELPKLGTEDLRKDFNNIAEDIVSISTRTNKLILTSDESYKTLQDNLQDFKLVINDLDERTRNFARESGIDRLDHKLGAINTMVQNGARANQVFNQVFEYLAEWVDKAGEQITSISDKVETLDDISQIKLMLEDLRAESKSGDNIGTELVNALDKVFEKQFKRMSTLEAKLDKIIVNSSVAKKNTKSDIKPIEDKLNKFMTALTDKMALQQEKIDSFESKLSKAVSLADKKETAQLTKKVGGMDKQLAKLNKSIEKIASNVVEK